MAIDSKIRERLSASALVSELTSVTTALGVLVATGWFFEQGQTVQRADRFHVPTGFVHTSSPPQVLVVLALFLIAVLATFLGIVVATIGLLVTVTSLVALVVWFLGWATYYMLSGQHVAALGSAVVAAGAAILLLLVYTRKALWRRLRKRYGPDEQAGDAVQAMGRFRRRIKAIWSWLSSKAITQKIKAGVQEDAKILDKVFTVVSVLSQAATWSIGISLAAVGVIHVGKFASKHDAPAYLMQKDATVQFAVLGDDGSGRFLIRQIATCADRKSYRFAEDKSHKLVAAKLVDPTDYEIIQTELTFRPDCG